jgi:hypothetical protein
LRAGKELRGLKLCPGTQWNCINEIVWRLTQDKISLLEKDIVAVKAAVGQPAGEAQPPEQTEHLAGLPIDIRWVYLHPGLCVKNAEDPSVRPTIDQYERDNPCPHRGARNRYNFLREHPLEVRKFFDYVDKLLLNPATGGEEADDGDSEEADAIDDIERDLAGGWKKG